MGPENTIPVCYFRLSKGAIKAQTVDHGLVSLRPLRLKNLFFCNAGTRAERKSQRTSSLEAPRIAILFPVTCRSVGRSVGSAEMAYDSALGRVNLPLITSGFERPFPTLELGPTLYTSVTGRIVVESRW